MQVDLLIHEFVGLTARISARPILGLWNIDRLASLESQRALIKMICEIFIGFFSNENRKERTREQKKNLSKK